MRDWLKDRRLKENLTQKEVADKLDVSEAYYNYIESGERQKKMDISLAAKLSVIFSIPIQQIVELENKPV